MDPTHFIAASTLDPAKPLADDTFYQTHGHPAFAWIAKWRRRLSTPPEADKPSRHTTPAFAVRHPAE